MEITDKRKFNEAGERVAEAVPDREAEINRILSEIPCVYSDPSPMPDYILVRQGEAQTTYRGTRFVIPQTAQQSPNKGVAVAVGRNIPAEDCKPGDIVTFGRFNAEPIEVDGVDFQLVNVHDIKLVEHVTYAVSA